MNTNSNNIQVYRENYILELNDVDNKTEYEKYHADSLFNLGLTMYSKEYSFKSAIYNGFACSHIDDNLSLHPEQMKVLSLIKDNNGLIFSAPTSFGKTFVVFEYIARENLKNVVLIVPTLALVDEYKQKILKKYKESFLEYKIYTSIDIEKKYDFEQKNLFILTHDRVVNEDVISIFSEIDFLVIDEVYKLKTDLGNDRVLILNLAYKFLMEKSKKYLLLAPFLKEVRNIDKIKNKPLFFSSNFSPVVNKVIERRITDENDRYLETVKVVNELENTKRLVYFHTVYSLNKFLSGTFKFNITTSKSSILDEFIEWASNEIHEEWSILKALNKGILVHHGQLPLGIRMLQLELFDDTDSGYDIMLCTSTLLEGVNTSCENIIITKPARNKTDFDAFDFFNLVGRTGRLCQYYLGTAYYIRGTNDREYRKEEALKSIEFELTDNSIDMDINSEKYNNHPEFLDLLQEMGISYEDYKKYFATQFRFSTVKAMYNKFKENKNLLYEAINKMLLSDKATKLGIVRELYKIIENNLKNYKLKTYIINVLTYKKSISVRTTIEKVRKAFNTSELDSIISEVLKLKNSYIEYDFYKKTGAILYFMELDKASENIKKPIKEEILEIIEKKYFMHSSCKKILKDMGIYDKDIDIISKIIGENISSVDELQIKINEKYKEFIKKISVISKFIVEKMIR
ncbi:DEAD/DEAH box helicase [Streptobacillus moniliformis]|uniref:DEAD/DEAH box helicase n=1 Tax=Streptobacillus moniliformis TaxID=34105 RepID=UPI0007E38DFF|nr:DEAD/DEAH box helicase [Streptobacillus moniliformis]